MSEQDVTPRDVAPPDEVPPWFTMYGHDQHGHWRARVFAGPDEGKRGRIGVLLMREEDRQMFERLAEAAPQLFALFEDPPETAEAIQRSQPFDGAARVARERLRQVEAEGWAAEHDRGHTDGELALAAAVYATPQGAARVALENLWPFEWETYKPGDRIRELEKAGALIAAEIDRLLALEGTKARP